MTNRFSTDILKRQGSRKRVRQIQDRFVNTFQSTFGNDKALELANVALSDKTLVGGQLKWNDFYAAKSFFNRRGLSESSAITMALLMIDVAKFADVGVMKIIEPLAAQDEVLFNLETYATLNFYRTPSSKQNLMVENDNSKSYRKRNILA